MSLVTPGNWDFMTVEERETWYAMVRAEAQLERVCYGNGHALLRPSGDDDLSDLTAAGLRDYAQPESSEQPEPDRDAALTLALLRRESPIPWLADIPDRPLRSPFGNRAPELITQPEPDRDTGLTLALLNVRGMVLAGMDAIDICDALDSALALLREKQS